MPTTMTSQDCLTTLSADSPERVPQRVLLVESQPEDAWNIQRWIEATGRFDVTVAAACPQTDALLLAEDWAAIIIDVHEPAIADVELVRRARATRGWTPVLLIMADDRDDQIGCALHASADAVVTGALAMGELIGTLMQLVRPPDQVAERRTLERGLRQRRLAAAVEPLAAGLAHEINNKLAPAVGFADLLINQLEGPGDARLIEYCTAVRDSAEAAGGVIRQLVKVSRPAPVSRGIADLRSIVRDALRSLRERLAETGTELALDLPATPVAVLADIGQLKQVVVSLVHNALDAMEETSGRALEVGLRIEHRDAVLYVRDSGPGIDAATLVRIFEPFFTTRGRAGMGLPLSYAVARQHQGDLTAESDGRDGATFRLRLPLDSSGVTHRPVTRAAGIVSTPATAVGGGDEARQAAAADTRPAGAIVRALLIDDDPALAVLVVEMLARRPGWQVDVAPDGLDAVRAIEAQSYDLVICDMLLPEITGRQLRDWVAARHPRLLSRLLFITGDPASDALQQLVAQGACWLEKPFTSRALFTACDAVLAGNRSH